MATPDMKDKIEAYATILQDQVGDKITDLLAFRPATYTLNDQPAFVPTSISLAVNGSPPGSPTGGISPPAAPPTLATPVISPLVPLVAPTFTDTLVLGNITAPQVLVTKSFSAPAFSLPSAPNAPSLESIAPPNLANIEIPSPMSLADIPDFRATMPVIGNTIDLPYTDNPLSGFNTTLYDKRVYKGEELTIINTALQDDIIKGRTGIPEGLEKEVWKRKAERDIIALQESLKLARNIFTKKGFSLPPGKMRKAEQQLIDSYSITKIDHSRDIAINQAESAQKNRQFAITSALQLEQQHMQFTIQTAGFMLDLARETVNAGIAIYNAHIAKMGIQLDIYKTEASVYEAQLRAFSIRIEAYKGELEGAKLRGDLNTQQIEIYKARISAQELLVNIFTARVNAVVAVGNLEKLKLDAFRGQIEAYQAEVQAKTAEFQGFEAQIKGEVAKAQVFEARVNAFRAGVEAVSEGNRALGLKAQAEGASASAVAEAAKVNVASYQAQVEYYKGVSLIALETYKAEVSAFLSQIDLAKAQADVAQGNQSTAVEVWKAQQNLILGRAEIMSENVKSENAMKVTANQIAGKMLEGILSALQAVGLEVVKKSA